MSQKTEVVITARDETRAGFASAQNGMKALASSAQSLTGGLGGLKSAASTLLPVLGGLGAALSIANFAETINGTIKFAAALDDMSERTGASVENLSALAGVAKIGGHDLDMVESSVIKLNKALQGSDDEAKGAAKALAAIGLSIKDLRDKDPAQAMLDVAKALDNFADSGEKTAVAMAVLGKAGAQALPFLKDLAEKGELVGKVTAEQAAQAEKYEKNMARLSAQLSAAGKAVAFDLLDPLVDLSAKMVAAAENGDKLKAVLLGLAGIGKIPIDIVFGSTKADASVAGTIKDFEGKLGGLQKELENTGGKGGVGFVSKLLFGGRTREDVQRDIDVTKNQLDALKKFGDKIEPKKSESGEQKPKIEFKSAPEPKPKTGGGGSARSQIDDAERMLATMRERITLNEQDLQSVDKMTAVEKEAAKVKLQLESGTLKATAAQKTAILANFEQLAAQEKALIAQEEFRRGVEQLEQTNARQRQAMVEQTEALKRSAETYGLAESTISSMVTARLEDAIATARQNGASEDAIATLEDELDLRMKLTSAMEDNDLARLVSNTTSAKAKKTESDIATLDRALASGKIDKKQYEEAISGIKENVSELDEFTKQAARNMQDAFADFLFDPFANGTKGMVVAFADAVRKMAAQALSAQIMNKLFGDMGKTGELGGLVGSLLGLGTSAASGASAASSTAAFIPYLWADGGIMTSDGPLPLRKYAGGGIARSPQLAMFGEGSSPEAYVPLPDGRRIPVAMSGGGAAQPQNIRIVNAFDSSVIGDYLGSSAGEKIIMNAVQRNAGSFRQAMA